MKHWSSSEAEVLERIVSSRQTFANTVHFALASAFPIPEHAYGQDVLVALNAPRSELGLSAEGKPGDIDLLMVPIGAQGPMAHRSIAIEAKIVRPTLDNPSRNVNTMGRTQALGLLADGFPFVGLIHIAIPQRLPEEMHWRVGKLTGELGANGELLEEPEPHLVDPFPLISAQRQLGRVEALDFPQDVGFNAISLTLSKDGERFVGNTIGDDRTSCRNRTCSDRLIDSISRFVEVRRNDFKLISWYGGSG